MEQIKIEGLKVISPMFSYGLRHRLEARPTELKGLLRNTFRISNPKLHLDELYKLEVELFGGQLEESGTVVVKASPLRIQMSEQKVNSDKSVQRLRLHRDKDGNNPSFSMFKIDSKFNLKLSVNYQNVDFDKIPFIKTKDELIQWYTDLFHLSLIIGGIGKRSRRGRGCMTTDDLMKISVNKLPGKVAELLNSMSKDKPYIAYEKSVKLQIPKENTNIKDNQNNQVVENRPYITEIRFGHQLKDITNGGIEQYLKKVDNASHEIKIRYKKSYAIGFVESGNRFASSVIVSLVEIKDGIIPVYTFLNTVCKYKDEQMKKGIKYHEADEEKNAFINLIEEGRGR